MSYEGGRAFVTYVLPANEPAEVGKASFTEYGPVAVHQIRLLPRRERVEIVGLPICERCSAPRGSLLFWCAKHQTTPTLLRYRAVLEEVYIAAVTDPEGGVDAEYHARLAKGDEARVALAPSDRVAAAQMVDSVKRRLQVVMARAQEDRAQQPEPWIDF